jgi:hypothetical protein
MRRKKLKFVLRAGGRLLYVLGAPDVMISIDGWLPRRDQLGSVEARGKRCGAVRHRKPGCPLIALPPNSKTMNSAPERISCSLRRPCQ